MHIVPVGYTVTKTSICTKQVILKSISAQWADNCRWYTVHCAFNMCKLYMYKYIYIHIQILQYMIYVYTCILLLVKNTCYQTHGLFLQLSPQRCCTCGTCTSCTAARAAVATGADGQSWQRGGAAVASKKHGFTVSRLE